MLPKPPMALMALRERPKVLGERRAAEGLLNWGVLSRLNISARNCIRKRSVIRVVFKIEKSVLMKLGPLTALRPKLPKCVIVVFEPGRAKTVPAGQGFVIVGLQTELLNQKTGSPMI